MMPKLQLTASLVERWVRYLLILLSLIAAAGFYYQGDRVSLASALLTVGLLLLPPLVPKLLRFSIPVSMRIVYLAFIIAAMYLGEIHSFFYRFLWWDDMLHTASAMLLAYIGLLLAYVVNKDSRIETRVSPWFLALFVFCFTMAFGGVWELFEFAADRLLGVNMLKGRDSTIPGSVYDQGRALLNTFQDLILDATGGLIIAAGTLLHLKFRGWASSAFGYLKQDFMQGNPYLFRSIK